MPVLSPTTIAVLGSGTDAHDDLARDVGALLARLGVNLLTGGGRGVMASAGRAYTRTPRTSGISIGIIPCVSERDRSVPKAGYPNPFVELAIYTHLPFNCERGTDDLSRNHINALSAAALIALPGGAGTRSEIELAVRYAKPVVIYAHDLAEVKDFPAAIPRVDTIDAVRSFVLLHVTPFTP